MYTAPTALLSLVVILPVLAGLAAIYYSNLNMVAGQLAEEERIRASRIAVLVITSEIEHNQTLADKLRAGTYTQADLEYLSGVATKVLKNLTGVPYSVSVYIAVVNTSIVLGPGGYEPTVEPIASLTYEARPSVSHWSYGAVSLGEGLYAVVGAGV